MIQMDLFSHVYRWKLQRVSLVVYAVGFLCVLFCIGSCSADWTATQWNEKGKQYYTNGDYDSAIFAFLKSIDIDPIVALVWNNLGITYEAKKMQTESTLAFKRALELGDCYNAGCCKNQNIYHMEAQSGSSSDNKDIVVAGNRDSSHFNGYSVFSSY